MTRTTGLTYADLLALPEDSVRRELFDGELVVSPSPNVRHHDLVRKKATDEDHAAPEFWYVDLENDEVHVHRHDGERYPPPAVHRRGEMLRSTALPGFEVAVDEVLGPSRSPAQRS